MSDTDKFTWALILLSVFLYLTGCTTPGDMGDDMGRAISERLKNG